MNPERFYRFKPPDNRNDVAVRSDGTPQTRTIRVHKPCGAYVVELHKGRAPTKPMSVAHRENQEGSLYDVIDNGDEYVYSIRKKHACSTTPSEKEAE